MSKELKFYKFLIDQFPKTQVLVIGDVMVDRFIRGKVSRISPEAPVPVVKVKEVSNMPGGAGNVIMNLAALGSNVTCCGVIGEDESGETLLNYFQKYGIRIDQVRKDATRPTIIKTRVIAEHQQVVRFDQESDHPISSPIQDSILDAIPQLVKACDSVILSDYGKGLITQQVLKTTIACCKRYKKTVCVDPKLEHFRSYQKVTCITPNLTEALGGMGRVRISDEEGVRKLGFDILRALKSESVLITQGEGGMTLFEQKGLQATHIPALAREVFDVTGAGDTVIGVLSLALASGATLIQAAKLANLAAGIVVGKLGTATVTPQELKAALHLL